MQEEITFDEYLKYHEEYEKEQRESPEYNLYKPFDIEKHKKKYTHYLEVVVDIDGTVHYSVPSHERKEIELYLKRIGKENSEENIQEVMKEGFDSTTGLEAITGCILLWEGNAVFYKINAKQLATLRKLRTSGLITFTIPSIEQLKSLNVWDSSHGDNLKEEMI